MQVEAGVNCFVHVRGRSSFFGSYRFQCLRLYTRLWVYLKDLTSKNKETRGGGRLRMITNKGNQTVKTAL